MKTNLFKSTVMVAAFVASCFGGMKAFQSYNSVGSSLLMANVEALSSDEGSYDKWAYLIWVGTGTYITNIHAGAELGGEIYVGKRLEGGLSASLNGSIDVGQFSEYKAECQENMGCFSSCQNQEWHKQDPDQIYIAGLMRGCGNSLY